jgi:ATP-binding cassette subfamily B protein
LRNHVGIICKNVPLLETVEENIKIAERNIPSDRVQEVAKIARIHEDIVGFEKGYATLVGERGSRFPAVRNNGWPSRACY